ncbi:50S ribosomal subunit protein L18 [Candidatus Desulfarcum epimagneticum]|uniref:Large ribosomal subunit protein uL18 n=1 Tax=uncultured Desulfobacteraceae bacterium TaxID=218296 RepID=A0A484HKN8_9BACT|nr:50S ribosomal subunit protein L18 [uncultured Desulfobacteraceae bacterium]
MASLSKKKTARLKRKKRIRKKVSGTAQRPRLTVFRSARHIYAQVIDDTQGRTLVSVSTLEKDLKAQVESKGKIDSAVMAGKMIGERALSQGIERVVFDRNGFRYHGRVKAISDSAREAGLKF